MPLERPLSACWPVLAMALPLLLPAADPDPIPPERRVDWSAAGARPAFPADAREIDFLAIHPEAYADNDIAPELQALIDHARGPLLIRFPEGEFTLRDPVRFDARTHNHPVVLRGAGMEATRFVFRPDAEGPERAAFMVRGRARPDGETAVTAGFEKGSRRVTVEDASGFRPGDTVVLRQDNDPAAIPTYRTDAGMPDRLTESLETWARRATGQTTTVLAIEENVLVLERSLHLTLDWGGLTALPVDARTQVGFEGFTVENVTDGDGIYLFIFREAAHCWVRDVRSAMAVKFHLLAVQCHHLTIADSFFDDGFRHGGGGYGYGVALEWASSDNLVINSLFRRLRHSLMFAKGISGNVYAYNYSFDNLQDGAPVAKDVSGHGHYPFMNLIEGNVVEFIHGSDYWGSLGPGNTYYRNRATTAGIRLDVFSPRQNVIANEITAPPESQRHARWDPAETELIDGVVVHQSVIDPLIFGNTSLDQPGVPPEDRNLPPSLFLEEPPDFWPEDLPWPALGPPHAPGTHEIPAMRRWAEIAGRYARPDGEPYFMEDFEGANLLWWFEGSELVEVTDGVYRARAATDADIMKAHCATAWCKVSLPAEWEMRLQAQVVGPPDGDFPPHLGIFFGVHGSPGSPTCSPAGAPEVTCRSPLTGSSRASSCCFAHHPATAVGGRHGYKRSRRRRAAGARSPQWREPARIG